MTKADIVEALRTAANQALGGDTFLSSLLDIMQERDEEWQE